MIKGLSVKGLITTTKTQSKGPHKWSSRAFLFFVFLVFPVKLHHLLHLSLVIEAMKANGYCSNLCMVRRVQALAGPEEMHLGASFWKVKSSSHIMSFHSFFGSQVFFVFKACLYNFWDNITVYFSSLLSVLCR